MHHGNALAGSNFFIVLVEASVNERHDTAVRLAAAFADFNDFGLHSNGVAVKQRLWKSHLVPAKVGYRRSQSGVSNRNANHHTQSQAAIDQPLAELRFFHVLSVDM